MRGIFIPEISLASCCEIHPGPGSGYGLCFFSCSLQPIKHSLRLSPCKKARRYDGVFINPWATSFFSPSLPPFVCTHSPTALAELLVDKRHPPRRPKCGCDRREVKNVGDGDCPPGNRQHGMFHQVFQVPTRSHSTIYAVWCPVSECCVRSYDRVCSYD